MTKIEGRAVFGIDIGGTTVKCGIFSGSGQMLYKDEIKTRTEEKGRYILSDISTHIRELMEKFTIDRKDVLGIGYGVPGPVQEDGVVNGCVNLGWGKVDVKKESEKLNDGIPSAAGNDANVAALGEFWRGAGKGTNSMVMITVGTGLGCGVITGGRVVFGAHGAGGELGHIPLVSGLTEPCNCGKTGCLEQAASATGIINAAKRRLAQTDEPSVLRGRESFMAKDVLDAAKAGDRLADDAVNYSAEYLARGLAVAAGVVDPEIYVIGGGVSKAGDFYLDKIRGYYQELAFYASRGAGIVQAALGNDAGMYGAARLVMDSLKD
jgi:glucokinase